MSIGTTSPLGDRLYLGMINSPLSQVTFSSQACVYKGLASECPGGGGASKSSPEEIHISIYVSHFAGERHSDLHFTI